MRRISSISMALVLVISVFAPALMAAHAGRMACHLAAQHTMKAHHCDGMDNMAAEDAEFVSGEEASVSSVPEPCPMDCCSLAFSTPQAAVTATTSLSVQLTLGHNREYSSIVLRSAGFSSHTDRGPPSA